MNASQTIIGGNKNWRLNDEIRCECINEKTQIADIMSPIIDWIEQTNISVIDDSLDKLVSWYEENITIRQ